METFSALRSPVNSTHKGQWRGALMFSFICAWINGWVNNGKAGDLLYLYSYANEIIATNMTKVCVRYDCPPLVESAKSIVIWFPLIKWQPRKKRHSSNLNCEWQFFIEIGSWHILSLFFYLFIHLLFIYLFIYLSLLLCRWLQHHGDYGNSFLCGNWLCYQLPLPGNKWRLRNTSVSWTSVRHV